MKKFIFTILLFSRFYVGFCQTTTTIDYLAASSQLSAITPQCNIFESLVGVGGVTNQSWAGGMGYTTGKGVFFHTNPAGYAGTAYLLYFNFAVGNQYAISITTNGGDGETVLATSAAVDITSLQNNFPSSNTSTCTDDPNVNGYYSQNYGHSASVIQPSSNTITIPPFIPTTSQQYFILWGFGGNGRLSADGFYISKITITVTTPGVTISPMALNYTCGNTVAQTFTSGYIGTAPNSYTWHLGAVPNGWYYNSAPAPATITQTSTTLNLTVPSCSNTMPSPIYVTGNFALGAKNSGTVTPTLNPMDISGETLICGTKPVPYSISNLTCSGATYNWTATPAGNVNLSCTNCAAPNVSEVIVGQSITLSATVNGACSTTPLNLVLPIEVGSPQLNFDYSMWGSCNGSMQQWQVADTPIYAGTNWHWTVGNLGQNSSIYIVSPYSPTTFIDVTGGGTVNISYTDLCGVPQTNGLTLYSNCHSMAIVAPNPSTGLMSVSTASNSSGAQAMTADANSSPSTTWKIYQINVLDQQGNLMKSFKYPGGSSSINIDLSSLITGTYTLSIFDNSTWQGQQIIIAR